MALADAGGRVESPPHDPAVITKRLPTAEREIHAIKKDSGFNGLCRASDVSRKRPRPQL